jgi:glycosyltransferase involved in cell wall biosynthesis
VSTKNQETEISVVLPCLDEAETLADVIFQVKNYAEKSGLAVEIIVADNGSIDGSQEIARLNGATVIDVPLKGYGSAIRSGIEAASNNFIIMGDADGSYALDDLSLFLDSLNQGADLVMGNRFAGGIQPGAMPWLHKYIGNPILSWIGRLFFKIHIYDFHCGMRAVRRNAILGLKLKTNGMEYATEKVVKASLKGLIIKEVPTILKPDGRTRAPHLRTWRDGWRHLIFLLAASPRWLFLYPGIFLFAVGLAGMFATALGSIHVVNLQLGLNTYFFSLALALVGLQTILISILARIFSKRVEMHPESRSSTWFERNFTLEKGILIGLLAVLAAFVDLSFLIYKWSDSGFTYLDPDTSLRLSGIFILLFSSGLQLIFSSFFASILQEY